MEKETSCINSRAILDYLKAHEIDFAGMIKDLDPEIDGLEDPESFLRDPNNWISSSVVSKLFESATRVLDDDQAAYKIGRYATENTALGFAQRIVVKAFWSIKMALKHSQKINDQWNRSKKVELKELKRNEAIVRLHWTPGMETSKHICQYNQGVYSYLPLIWGGSRLTLKEKCCYFDGAPYCEYHLKWPLRNRFREIISRFFKSQSLLKDIIKEIEKDKKIINQKNDELRSTNKKLQQTLSEHRRAEKQLKESELKYRLIAENATDIIWILNLSTLTLDYVSPSIERIRGFTQAEAKALTLEQQMSPESYQMAIEILNEELSNDSKEGIDNNRSVTIEVQESLKGGGYLWEELSASFIRDTNGKPTAVMGVTRDIEARKKVELEKAEKMEQLQQALAEIKTLQGMLPICSACKRIRDDAGYWQIIEGYIEKHTTAQFTHSICPECSKKLYPDLV